MIQLDIIKRHILPEKCSQRYETKLVNSKKYDEKLNLTGPSIENKLSEINKEL